METHKGEPVGTFYNYIDYKDPENQTALRIVSNLLQQLLARERFVPPELKLLYKKWLADNSRPDSRTITNIFLDAVNRYVSVYVIVDALDECEFDYQDDLFDIVRQFIDSNVRVLVTSRPHLPVLDRYIDGASIREIVAHEDDFSMFLKWKLDQVHHIATSLKEKIHVKLCSVPQGMYRPFENRLRDLGFCSLSIS